MIAQKGGVIAYTGEPVTKTVNGVDYVFGAKLVASATLVTWGYGLEAEYWVAGATATHADVILDGMFVYAFKPITVGAEAVTAEIEFKSVVAGKALIELEANNTITFRLLVAADAGLTEVVFAGKTFDLTLRAPVDGYYVLSYVASPSDAADTLAISAKGAYEHTLALDIEDYASAVLADAALASAHNLVYALVEYVELMSGKDIAVDAPAGYVAKSVTPVASENVKDGVLQLFAICHDEKITIAVSGTAGQPVSFAYEWDDTIKTKPIEANGYATFEIDTVAILSGNFIFYTDGATYTYSLANYINAIDNEVVVAKLQALYNYAAYAAAYNG
jgi:hypothetical protein